jgi:hypothetical protein
MKRFAFLVLMAALAAAQNTAPTNTSPAEQDNAQRAKMLIDQAIQALGGPAYLNIQDISQEGRTYSFHLGQPNSVGIPFWRFYRYPDKDRVEVTKQRDVAYIYNGDKGYEITFKGTALVEPKDLADYVRRRHFSLDWVLRKWINEPGVAFFYEGPAVAEQKQALQVTIMNAKNEAVTLYLDSTTHLPVKKTFSWRDPTDKQRNIEDEEYDAYRATQGIMTPYSITRFYNGDMSNQRFLNTVTYNKGFNDSMFAATVTYDPRKSPGRH